MNNKKPLVIVFYKRIQMILKDIQISDFFLNNIILKSDFKK